MKLGIMVIPVWYPPGWYPIGLHPQYKASKFIRWHCVIQLGEDNVQWVQIDGPDTYIQAMDTLLNYAIDLFKDQDSKNPRILLPPQ
jgi:hypothetical protein